MSVLWCSDLHTKPASVLRKRTLSDDAFYALDQIQDIAIVEGVSAVILGGDVYDSATPPGEAINRMAAFVNTLTQVHGIEVYYIEGNHDRINRNPYLSEEYYFEHRLLSSIGAIPLHHRHTTKIGNVTYAGIDYCPTAKLHERLDELVECDVLCLHAGFRHLLGFDGAYDLTESDLPDTVKKLVLVGHVHTHDEYVNPRGVKIASSGSTWVWRVTECDKEHGVFIVDDAANVRFVPLECRRYFDITEVQDIHDTIAENHKLRPILFYDPVTLKLPENAQYDGVILIPRGTKEAEEVQEAQDHAAMSLSEALQLGVPIDEYPEEHAFIRDLLEAADPQAFTDEFLRERGVTMKESA